MASYAPIFVLAFLHLIRLPPYLATAANVTVPSSLSTNSNNSSWISSSGDFAFGFHQLNNSDLFLLAIWYNNIPEKTIIWNANGDNPAPAGSVLVLTENGLSLNTSGGKSIWLVRPPGTVSHASMLDTGNFVLSSENSANVWETFKYPTDTILPTQKLDPGSRLFSRIAESNFSRGRFVLQFTNESLQLKPVGWPSEALYKDYHNFLPADLNASLQQLVFNESGNLFLERAEGGIVNLQGWRNVVYTHSNYYRVTLDFDGVFRLYSQSGSDSSDFSWVTEQFVPENICRGLADVIGSGACGFNSYCRNEDGKPICECPLDFVPMDPNIRFSGCKPTYYLGGCAEEPHERRDPEELYEMREVHESNWPYGDYERLASYNLTECKKSCLNDCMCNVAMYGANVCWKKRFPIGNGRFAMNSSTVLFKVRKGDSPSPFNDNFGRIKDKRVNLVGAVLFGCSAFFITILIVYVVSLFFQGKKKGGYKNIQDLRLSEIDLNLQIFSYEELEEITAGFQEELGRGSFGNVYKGTLGSGSKKTVAVKKLDDLAREREKELKTEVVGIGRTNHKNLVQLLGFCAEGVNRLLVYEYMSNGTLADFLFSNPKPDWNMRVKIALEIAKGLVYLHEECSVPIIHCDIKPQNILLDDLFVAKISDFGLSKLLQPNQNETCTIIRGTRGYVAPEWFKNVAVTAKVDVYSFGVMLLEIICCRRSVEMELEEEEEEKVILTDWVYDCYAEGRLDVLMEDDEVAVIDKETAYRWLMVAIWCIQDDPLKRPTMKMVMLMLEGLVKVTKPPWPSSFSIMVLDQSNTDSECISLKQ